MCLIVRLWAYHRVSGHWGVYDDDDDDECVYEKYRLH